MANRATEAQSVHDAVISARENAWKADNRHVQSWTNPDGEHNSYYEFDGEKFYPDLIVKIKVGDGNNTQIGIEEVETADSVSANEVQQWRSYAALPQPSWFILLVPSDSVAVAKKLAKGLTLYVAGYWRDANGNFVFGEAEAPDK